jgi:hypothetical protein
MALLCGIQKALGEGSIEPASAPSKAVSAPIDVQRVSFLGIQDFQLYSRENEMIDYVGLTDRMGSLQDDEISRLIKTSQSSSDTGRWCDGLGLGLGAVGAGFEIAGSSDSKTAGLGILLGGVGLKLAGAFFMNQAGTSLFNAVERYNRFYWKEKGDLARPAKGLAPIHTHFSTWNGFEYECAGKKLENSKDFTPLFEAANDYEVQRLFKDSEGSGTMGSILGVAGVLGCLGSAAGYFSSENSGEKTGFVWAFASSAVVGWVGNLFLKGAESGRFNAVQRYNRFARGQEAVLPKGPENEKELLNFDSPVSKNGKNP